MYYKFADVSNNVNELAFLRQASNLNYKINGQRLWTVFESIYEIGNGLTPLDMTGMDEQFTKLLGVHPWNSGGGCMIWTVLIDERMYLHVSPEAWSVMYSINDISDPYHNVVSDPALACDDQECVTVFMQSFNS